MAENLAVVGPKMKDELKIFKVHMLLLSSVLTCEM